MRILIADKLAEPVGPALDALGAEVRTDPSLSGEALTAAMADFDPEVVVVRSTKVTRADLEAGSNLALVIRAGAGVNTIDLEAASGLGVYVANCPGKNADAVAELTIGLMIGLDRQIADGVAALRDGRWDKKGFGGAPGLRGRRLAVIGCGRIGQAVIRIARAMGMEVVAWSRSLTDETAEELGVRRAPSVVDAVRGAYVVTVHLALSDDTRGIISAEVIDAMEDGALFINTARAPVVDETALLDAIEHRGLRAGLDVFAGEPAEKTGTIDDPVAGHPRVHGTHHIGASTAQAEEAVGEEVVRIIEAYSAGEPVPNCVNLAAATPATHLLVVRHEDRVGVLAGVLDALREAGQNVEDMQNIVFEGAKSASARVAVSGAPDQSTLDAIAAVDGVFAVKLTEKTT